MEEAISRDSKNAEIFEVNMRNVCDYDCEAGKRAYAAEGSISPQTPTGKARRGFIK